MKKHSLFFAIPLCLSFLAGCGKGAQLPTTKYEKVQYALNGVEKSLTNQKGATKKSKLLPKSKRSEADAVDAIYSLFSQGTAGQPDFKYDEPPMIQFLYIKKTLEKIGSGFDFGVKYQTTITGSIYYDFATGKETQEASFKQDYSLNFSLYINIDDNDLIDCQTLFDVNYAHDGEVHHQVMYAYLMLDYDMTKTDANYKLKLYAADDCSDFRNDEEKHFSAEFDYVDVSNNAINEWGKIGYSTNKAIVLDAAHDSLADYFSEGDMKFKPTIQLYRNGLRYERNQLDDGKARQGATIACDDLGVNATDIKYKDYISKPHTEQPVLKTCFDDFSKIYGRDLMYNIVYTGAKSDSHEGGEGEEDRVDSSWPTQSLIDDGYGDVPGFLSKTATFSVNRDYADDTQSYFYSITVHDFQADDFDRYQRTLVENGFAETKGEEAIAYLHTGNNGIADYAVSIIRIGMTDMIFIGKIAQQEEKEDILIQNANTYTGDYSSYKETSYQKSSDVAAIVERLSGGRISASTITQYVISGASKSYEITLDLGEFTNDDLNRNYSEYLKSYSNWSIIDSNGAFYTTNNGVDVLVMLDKDSSRGIIAVHSFAFVQGSINEILSGGGGGGGGGGSQDPIMVTVYLYEVTDGVPSPVGTYTFEDGQSINLIEVFGPGKYYQEPGCVIPLPDDVVVHEGMSIYRKVESQEQTQGSIVIIDANTEQDLVTYTDVIGATVKGGAIFSYVLYKDSSCSSMVGLDEELTLSAEPITLYCQDYSKEDYVTLTVNTYINGILSPYRTREFGIRKGEILNNYSSYSFPVYYDDASFFDPNFTMTLDGRELGRYTQDLIALTENGVLNIRCENDWCNVYHIKNGAGEVQFDALWEGGSLSEGDVVLHNSRYYHISSVIGSEATYDSSETAYTFNECQVFNAKVITTQKDYFPASLGWTFYIGPNDTPTYFLDPELTKPLMPEEGQSEVVFKHSFTLYMPFTK